MSVIKPINFARMYLDENRISGSVKQRISILLDSTKQNTEANQRQVMAPSKIQHIIDAGSVARKAQIVVEAANDVSEVALDPTPPAMATAMKKLDII